MIVGKFIAVIIIGYLLGAIPFGVLVSRLTKGVDIREYGSGRTGVANVMRTAGKAAGVMVFVADVGKGAGAALIAWAIFGSGAATLNAAIVVAALAAIIGHNWSVYIKFQGGRGVTTAMGGLMVMDWRVGLACFAVFLAVVALSRYMSLGSILGTGSVIVVMIPLVLLKIEPLEYLIYGLAATGLIVFQHRDNIRRLLAGTERKIGQKAEQRKGVTG